MTRRRRAHFDWIATNCQPLNIYKYMYIWRKTNQQRSIDRFIILISDLLHAVRADSCSTAACFYTDTHIFCPHYVERYWWERRESEFFFLPPNQQIVYIDICSCAPAAGTGEADDPEIILPKSGLIVRRRLTCDGQPEWRWGPANVRHGCVRTQRQESERIMSCTYDASH